MSDKPMEERIRDMEVIEPEWWLVHYLQVRYREACDSRDELKACVDALHAALLRLYQASRKTVGLELADDLELLEARVQANVAISKVPA